jgi:hypothetical protein
MREKVDVPIETWLRIATPCSFFTAPAGPLNRFKSMMSTAGVCRMTVRVVLARD